MSLVHSGIRVAHVSLFSFLSRCTLSRRIESSYCFNAGREAAGKAYRLFTEATFQQLAPATAPEIQRTNLSSVVLQLKAMGIEDVISFDFLDPPPRAAIVRSLELLYALGE